MRKFDRVFVYGAYIPNGGTYMAYHLGRILERDFGIPATAVRAADESADGGVQHYDLPMPLVPREVMEREAGERDLLIINPSFSVHQFGWRLPGFKLCYVQDFKTFALLDRKFDHYVAVGDFVRDFLRTVYDLDVKVIAPFIHLDEIPSATGWAERPAHRVQPFRKGIAEIWDLSYQRIRQIVAERAPEIVFAEPIGASGVPQQELHAGIAQSRYFLTLSAAEGFGLVPLEAMALGATVIGYDAFGGRQYMRSGENCLVAPYPDVDRVAQMLIDAVRDPMRSARIAASGQATARQYSYAAFRAAWIAEFEGIFARR